MHWGRMEAAEVIRWGWVVFTNSNTEESADKFHHVSWHPGFDVISHLPIALLLSHLRCLRECLRGQLESSRWYWATVVAAKQWYWLKHDLESILSNCTMLSKKLNRLVTFFHIPPFTQLEKKERDFSPEGESSIDVPESGQKGTPFQVQASPLQINHFISER